MSSYKSFLQIGIIGGVNLDHLLKNAYELNTCEYFFQQGIDHKGKVSTEVFGGTISAVLPTLPSNQIIEWSLNSYQRHNGAIIVLDAFSIPSEKILFENAACIEFGFEFNAIGNTYPSTSLTIQAERIIVGTTGIDFDNFWTK
ncbi:MAG: type VI secretion system tube protein TssD [Suipraeoptans sp.]